MGMGLFTPSLHVVFAFLSELGILIKTFLLMFAANRVYYIGLGRRVEKEPFILLSFALPFLPSITEFTMV